MDLVGDACALELRARIDGLLVRRGRIALRTRWEPSVFGSETVRYTLPPTAFSTQASCTL